MVLYKKDSLENVGTRYSRRKKKKGREIYATVQSRTKLSLELRVKYTKVPVGLEVRCQQKRKKSKKEEGGRERERAAHKKLKKNVFVELSIISAALLASPAVASSKRHQGGNMLRTAEGGGVAARARYDKVDKMWTEKPEYKRKSLLYLLAI